VWLLRPMMTWSCNTSGAAAFLMSWVTVMSAFDGIGSPEGWLCTITILDLLGTADLLAIGSLVT
jgi:hypothetical protein